MRHQSVFEKKVEVKREFTAYEKLKDYVISRTNSFFLANLPSEDIKAMAPEYLYPTGVAVFVSFFAIFFTVFFNGYYDSVHSTFLSPYDSGTSAKSGCMKIPTFNTGSYLATQTGAWQGAKGFNFGLATFQLSITSLSLDDEEYSRLMTRAYTELSTLKVPSEHNDLARNLIGWMSIAYLPYIDNIAQRLELVGSPYVVFSREVVVGGISNVLGDCNATSTAGFDRNSGILTVGFNYEEYIKDPICNASVSPELAGYIPLAGNNIFSLKVDVRSLVTATAVNIGILKIETLIEIPSLGLQYTLDGVTYNVSVYYDQKYSGMAPISCLNIVDESTGASFPNCIVTLSSALYGIPLFNHYGTSKDLPMSCNCSTLTEEELSDNSFSCNVFSFLTGVLFFPTNNTASIVRMWLHYGLVHSKYVTTSPINQMSFTAQFMGGYYGKTSPNRSLFETTEYRESAYEFCNVPGNNVPCSFLTFSLFDLTTFNWAITDYYFQLMNGACRNTFVPEASEW
jgi:hypothetical protein